VPYTNYTLTQLIGLLDNQLGASADVWWTTAEKTLYINEGLRVFNALTGYWKQTDEPLVTVADQVWYTLPGTITSGMRVSFNGVPMTPSSLNDMDQGQPYWESETTVSGGTVPSTPQMWGIGAMNLIAIWPADHVGGNSLLVDGIAVTPVLVNGGDYIDIGDEELNGLLAYWQHIAMFKDAGPTFEASIPQFQDFLKSAATRNSMLMASSLFRTAMGVDDGRAEIPRRYGNKVGAR